MLIKIIKVDKQYLKLDKCVLKFTYWFGIAIYHTICLYVNELILFNRINSFEQQYMEQFHYLQRTD